MQRHIGPVDLALHFICYMPVYYIFVIVMFIYSICLHMLANTAKKGTTKKTSVVYIFLTVHILLL